MKVRAKEKGYDGHALREVGDVFDVSEQVFDAHWMEKVGPQAAAAAPEATSAEETGPTDEPRGRHGRGGRRATQKTT